MTTAGEAGRATAAGRSRAALAVLFAVANAPALALLAWLLADAAVGAAAPSSLARGAAAAGAVAALAAAVALFVTCVRQDRRFEEALADRDERGERLHALVESAPLAVLSINGENTILSCNEAGAALFGYRPDELKGEPLTRLLPGDVARRTAEAKTDEQRSLGGAVGARKDGSRFPAAVTVRKTRHGRQSLSVVVVSDLTEISHARHAAHAAGRAKYSLLRLVNHELRTPMGGIIGAADLLRQAAPSDEQGRHIEMIRESAEALLRVFDHLIDHARLEAGQLALVRQPFSLRQCVEQSLAPFGPLARAKGLRLEVRVAAELPDDYVGDAARLGQILAALAGNAVKFTHRGEVRVTATEGAGGRVRFEVSDTGVGIEAGRLARIFEPFEQGDGSPRRGHGGLGLGLSTASRLAELMGGRIEPRSEPGRGSSFRFELVLSCGGAPAPSAVLVVLAADEERRAVVRRLAEWGVAASGAPTGRHALTELLRAVVEGSPFGLVLIEEHLPDLSAREVLARLRQRGDSAPPAVLLGRTEVDVPPPDGVRAVLSRHASGEELYQAVLNACASR